MKTAAVWFRRDLRLQDHTALSNAMKWAEKNDARLLLFFQMNPHFLSDSIDKRHQYFFQTLYLFMKECESKNIAFHLLSGETDKVFTSLIDNLPEIEMFFFNEDETGYGKKRDEVVMKLIQDKNRKVYTFQDHFLHGAQEVKKQNGEFYKVFTPYYRAWRQLDKSRPLQINLKALAERARRFEKLTADGNRELEVIAGDFEKREDIGEADALKTLKSFTSERLEDYHKKRDLPAVNGTSKLSRHLKTGAISPRTVYHYVSQIEVVQDSGKETFVKELAWRDFYNMVYVQFPNSAVEEADERYHKINWSRNNERLKAWCDGKTGYPIVDAGMRQLNAEGWMHNRLRMITASFLTKDYLLDWRLGEEYFAKKLVDYEPASNIGGWQWAASVGTDAVPYFRVFNPVTQSKRFDPDGEFIRKYVPELKDVDARFIHEPWKMNNDQQKQANCRVGEDYPEPTVEHSEQRKKAIEMFKGL
ncbi:cryptochrome/photolyase family protein [Peribacillus frigoritolerans]|uniref:cryptochrome/photolyase family protein n=1 Tax=Peribacillus frigoritolerans TaxID=450367 RepID=UPI00105A7F72|nr:deoxyribodipyrimidine photo-lyase [Peribacillus frigoritolerans]TDL80009.1 deoxyribodipyrimidine photo-lyase [Peribacillus frigoritolerans]